MNKKVIGVVIAVGIICFAIYTFMGGQEVSVPVPTASEGIEVTAVHTYTGGTHTLVGSVVVPTPCHALTYEYIIAESYPEQVIVEFTTKSMSEICAQVMTPAPFDIEFIASEEAHIRATLNGESVDLILHVDTTTGSEYSLPENIPEVLRDPAMADELLEESLAEETEE